MAFFHRMHAARIGIAGRESQRVATLKAEIDRASDDDGRVVARVLGMLSDTQVGALRRVLGVGGTDADARRLVGELTEAQRDLLQRKLFGRAA